MSDTPGKETMPFCEFEHVGQRLRTLRAERDLGLSEFARRVKMDPAYVCRIEAGTNTNLSMRTVSIFAEAFGLSISAFLAGVGYVRD